MGKKTDLQLLNPNAVLARDFSLEPIIYDIWWRFSPPNSESGGTFCPRSGNIAKIANLDSNTHNSVSNGRYLLP